VACARARRQTVLRPLDDPIKKSGHIQILHGNLAPTGAVAKITGKEGERFRGPARVFDNEQDMVCQIENRDRHIDTDRERRKRGETEGACVCVYMCLCDCV
jgi:dihydroxyacid dehydratase/phosphogluconate dehydratase